MSRDETLRVRVSQALKDRVQAIADARDLDLSDVVREALNKYLDSQLKVAEGGQPSTAAGTADTANHETLLAAAARAYLQTAATKEPIYRRPSRPGKPAKPRK